MFPLGGRVGWFIETLPWNASHLKKSKIWRQKRKVCVCICECVSVWVCSHVAVHRLCFSNHLHVWNLDSTDHPSVKLDAVQHKCLPPSSFSCRLHLSVMSLAQCVANGLKKNVASEIIGIEFHLSFFFTKSLLSPAHKKTCFSVGCIIVYFE